MVVGVDLGGVGGIVAVLEVGLAGRGGSCGEVDTNVWGRRGTISAGGMRIRGEEAGVA